MHNARAAKHASPYATNASLRPSEQMAQVASRWDERLAKIKRIAEAAHDTPRAANAK